MQISFAKQGGSGTPVPDLSIEVDDVDAALEAMKKAGFAIEYGPADEPWGVRRFLCATRSAGWSTSSRIRPAAFQPIGWRDSAPSVLPDISPTGGEIGSFAASPGFAAFKIGESQAAGRSPHLSGEMSGRTEGGNVER